MVKTWANKPILVFRERKCIRLEHTERFTRSHNMDAVKLVMIEPGVDIDR